MRGPSDVGDRYPVSCETNRMRPGVLKPSPSCLLSISPSTCAVSIISSARISLTELQQVSIASYTKHACWYLVFSSMCYKTVARQITAQATSGCWVLLDMVGALTMCKQSPAVSKGMDTSYWSYGAKLELATLAASLMLRYALHPTVVCQRQQQHHRQQH